MDDVFYPKQQQQQQLFERLPKQHAWTVHAWLRKIRAKKSFKGSSVHGAIYIKGLGEITKLGSIVSFLSPSPKIAGFP